MTMWTDKPMVPDHKRNADREMVKLGLETSDIIEILEKGKQIRKRKENIIEKWYHQGKRIYIVAVEDMDDYWLVRHVGMIKASRRKLKILRGEKT